MASHQCRRCLPNVVTFANEGNLKSHLGATNIPGHNMGPWRCQHPGCTRRSVRNVPNVNHGNHVAVWFRDPALLGPLNAMATQCRLPWAPAPVAPPAAAVAAAVAVPAPVVVVVPVVAPPVVAQGLPGTALGLAAPIPLPGVGQAPPVVTQVPAIAAPVAQVPAPAPMAHAHVPVAHAPASGPLVGDTTNGTPATDAESPPPTNYFNQEMDVFEEQHAGETREDVEKQYEQGMWPSL
ncbi:hypothetical protein QM012_005032 [Aureobasidium pullulans]|uniref:C2H2-type domain-containing protein n=1 Tax=Aureobasidium pullulans TaxID=5580 RepID=A0ABR0T669_AURPU